MLRLIKIYFLYFAQSLKARMSYTTDFIALTISSIFITLAGFLFIYFLMDGETVKSLGTWSRYEVLFIYGFASIAGAIFSILSPNLFSFGDKYVIQGQYDRVLLRPLNSLSQVLFESFNMESLGSLIVGIGIMLYATSGLELQFSLIDLFWLVLSEISAATILLSIFVALASLSFHFEDRIGIAPPVFNLMMFSRYPLPIFNNVVQVLLTWILPFAFAGFFPATHFLSRGGFEWFCYGTPLMAVVCLTLAAGLWKFGEGKYASVGN